MRSLFVIAANLAALRFEVSDFQYSLSKRTGLSPEEVKKIADAINAIGYAETQLKSFRFISSVNDILEAKVKNAQKAKK